AKRAAVVDVIDIRYWYYEEDGKVYAPLGGQSLAPRQHERLLKPKRPSFESVYKAVSEYRLLYPAKAVMYSAEGCDNFGWAVFMGGGSLANVPVSDVNFLRAAAAMQPVELGGLHALRNKSGDYIVYAVGVETVKLPGKWKVVRVDAQTGKVGDAMVVEGAEVPGKAVLWITK
ncbi:MAG TPA: DUF6298 domain-containing protein, partial [Puia sp.]|nr:DUF6298 domain-containing protein [Puia sp.]